MHLQGNAFVVCLRRHGQASTRTTHIHKDMGATKLILLVDRQFVLHSTAPNYDPQLRFVRHRRGQDAFHGMCRTRVAYPTLVGQQHRKELHNPLSLISLTYQRMQLPQFYWWLTFANIT